MRFDLLCCFIFILSFFACNGKDEEMTQIFPSPENKVFDKNHLKGCWLLKGNSSTMALVQFDVNATSYSSVNGSTNYNGGSYIIVEYRYNNGTYEFMGQYDGYYNFDSSGKLDVDKAKYCFTSPDANSIQREGQISRHSLLSKQFEIENLEVNHIRISDGNTFYEGTRNTDYTEGSETQVVGKTDFADLGLSVMWAKCNIGASKAEQFGTYAGWADPTGTKTSTTNEDYPAASYPNVPSKISGTSYDIATAKWGDKWRMPTYKEMQELDFACIGEEIVFNGVACRKYMGITGQSIILPRAGKRIGNTISNTNQDLAYWSGDVYSYSWELAWGIFQGSVSGWYEKRYVGCQIRAVCNK